MNSEKKRQTDVFGSSLLSNQNLTLNTANDFSVFPSLLSIIAMARSFTLAQP